MCVVTIIILIVLLALVNILKALRQLISFKHEMNTLKLSLFWTNKLRKRPAEFFLPPI